MYKGTNGVSLFVHSVTLLDHKLCHKVQTGICTMETCIWLCSIWDILKNEEVVLIKDVAVAVTCNPYVKLLYCKWHQVLCSCVGDWLVKGSGVRGFICVEELQIVQLERNRVAGYWILADMRYSYESECTVASNGKPLHTRLVTEIQY